jgi:hypothetical protein
MQEISLAPVNSNARNITCTCKFYHRKYHVVPVNSTAGYIIAPVNSTAGNTETAHTAIKVIQKDSGPYKSQYFNGACPVCVYKGTYLHSTNHTAKAIVSVFGEILAKRQKSSEVFNNTSKNKTGNVLITLRHI